MTLGPRGAAGVVAAAGAVAHGALTLRRYHRFEYTSYDNAIFEQAIAGYARDGVPIVDVKGPGFHILGDHFSPIYALLAPVYRLFPSAQTVLLAQVVLVAVSIFVVTAVAARVLGRGWGVAVGVMYAVSFGLQSAVRSDFHEVAFAAPLLALAGAAFVERRFGAVVGWTLPLVLVKEDLGLTVAAVGVVLGLVGERGRGAFLVIAGLAATVLTVQVIIPAFAVDGAYPYGSALGGDSGVLDTLVLEGSGRKVATLALTFGITGLAALASPWALVAVPTLLWRFAGDNPAYWGTEWHYSLVVMPIVFIALIDAVRRFDAARWLIPVGAVVTAVTFVGSPLAELLDADAWSEPERVATARAIVEAVPEGASVETDIGLLSHLVTNRTTYWIGTIRSGPDRARPEYVAFDVESPLGSPQDPVGYAEDGYGGTWDVLIDRDGYVLARSR